MTEPLSPPDLRAEYDLATAHVVRQRLTVTVGFFLALVGVSVLLEQTHHPERSEAVWLVYAVEVVASAVALALVRVPRLVSYTLAVAAALGAIFSVCFTTYSAWVGSEVERIATAQVCLLTSLLVLLPWGWRAQLTVALVALASLGGVVPEAGITEPFSYAILAIVAGGVTSVVGASYLDRYRFAAHANTARAEEQAEIAAALRHVAETLNANLGRPDMLEQVTALAVSVLRCDWGATFFWDERRQALQLRGAAGIRPDALEEASNLGFVPEAAAIVRALEPGRLLDLAELCERGLVSADLLARWDIGSGVCAPIPRRGVVVGFLCVGHRIGTEPRAAALSPRQRVLALGIADATAVAFDNARLIADLQSANALKSEFVSTMSHELRTPLNVILGFTEMARDPELRAERDALLSRVEVAARDLLDLVESTLAVGKLEAGRDELHLETIRLPEFWQKLRDGFMALARRPEVTLEWCADVPDVELTTDPRKLAIVTRNLVGNALKFTERGWVRATASADDDGVVIRVADTGIGIRPEDQETVFEMFRQADGSEVRRFGGTGLGLYIVRRFVDRLGGTVSVESAPGRGSVFTVRLAAARDSLAGREDA